MDKKLYKFGMDWLNGVLPVADVKAVFDMLEVFSSKLRFDRWTLVNSGLYNYSRRYMLDGSASIQLMFNPVSEEHNMIACSGEDWDFSKPQSQSDVIAFHNNPGVFFSISGDGIRKLQKMGGDVSALNKLLFYFYRHDFKASRFDVYCDILDKDNEIVPLIQEAFEYVGKEQVGKPAICCKFQRSANSINNNFRRIPMFDENFNSFLNCQLGHHGSRCGMFRCYNKRVEVLTGRLARLEQDKPKKNGLKQLEYELSFAKKLFDEYGVDDYWYRLEYEMHKDNAAAAFTALMKNAESCNTPLCFEDIFFSVFNKVFKIVVKPSVGYTLSSSPSAPAWVAFHDELSANTEYLVQFGGVPYIEVTLSRVGKNARRIKGYLFEVHQWLGSLPFKERRQFWIEAKECYDSNSKYNTFRDELEEFNSSVCKLRRKAFDVSWVQSELSFDELSLFA